MNEAWQAWMEFAARDLAAAQSLVADDYLANAAMFHAQQAAEKALKAVMESHGQPIPRIHSLRTLYQRAQEACGGRMTLASEEDLLLLDEVYIDSRYPGGAGLLPGGMPTHQDAQRALESARRVLAAVEQVLGAAKR
jgi:HEPN domain-containing protein